MSALILAEYLVFAAALGGLLGAYLLVGAPRLRGARAGAAYLLLFSLGLFLRLVAPLLPPAAADAVAFWPWIAWIPLAALAPARAGDWRGRPALVLAAGLLTLLLWHAGYREAIWPLTWMLAGLIVYDGWRGDLHARGVGTALGGLVLWLGPWLEQSTRWPAGLLGVFLIALLLYAVGQGRWVVWPELAPDARRTRRRLLNLAAAAWLLCWAGGFGLVFFQHQSGERRERDQFYRQARLAAAALSPVELRALRADPAAPAQAVARLRQVRDAVPDSRFVYLMEARDGQVFFLADAEPESSSDYSPPGSSFDEADASLRAAFATGETFVRGPLRDRWGVWISAYTPVRALDGPLIYLGMDISARRWERIIFSYRLAGMGLTAIAQFVLLLLFAGLHRAGAAAERIAASEARLRAVHDFAPLAILLAEPAGGRVLSANRAAVRLFDLSAERLCEQRFPELAAAPESAARALDFLVRCVRTPGGAAETFTLRRGAQAVTVEITGAGILWRGGRQALMFARDVTRRVASEKRLLRLHECLLQFAADPLVNIQTVTALCGELLGADAARYHRLDGGQLRALGQWRLPEDTRIAVAPAGRICYEAIRRGGDAPLVVADLPRSEYARSDPEVLAHGLQTYIGQPVRLGAHIVGSLCAVFRRPATFDEEDRRLLGLLASAIAVEESRRQAREELQATLNMQQAIFEAAGSAIIATTADGVITIFNDAAERLLGYRAGELIGRLTPAVFHDSAEVAARAAELTEELGEPVAPGFGVFTALARRGRAETRDWTYVRRDGNRIPVELTVTARRAADGQVEGYVGIATDISPRQANEQALRRRDALLSGVARAANDLLDPSASAAAMTAALADLGEAARVDRVYIFQAQRDGAAASEYLSRRYEWAREGVSAQLDNPELQQLPWPDALPRWRELFQQGLAVAGPVRHRPPDERRLFEPQGIRSLLAVPLRTGDVFRGFIGFDDCREERAWSESEISILQAAAGLFGGWMQRQRAEAALRDSEQRFRDVTAAAGEYVWETDPLGHFTFLTERVRAILQYEPAQLLGRTPFEFMPDDEADRVRRFFADAVRKRLSFSALEHRSRTRGGAIIWQQISGVPFCDDTGALRGFRGTGLDITGRKESEQKLRDTLAELESFNRAFAGREERIIELKREVNDLLTAQRQPPRYTAADDPPRAAADGGNHP